MTAKLESISEVDPGLKLVIQRRQVGGDDPFAHGVCAHEVCPWSVPMGCVCSWGVCAHGGVCPWSVPMGCVCSWVCAHGCVLMGSVPMGCVCSWVCVGVCAIWRAIESTLAPRLSDMG